MLERLIQKISDSADNIVSASDNSLTYREVIELARRLGEKLSHHNGSKPGNLVFMVLPNGLEFVVTFLALAFLRAKIALVPTAYRQNEFTEIFTQLRPDLILTVESLLPEVSKRIPVSNTAKAAIAKGLEKIIIIENDEDSAGPGAHMTRIDMPSFYDDTSIIKFTSGSGGRIKAVALSSDNIVAEANNIVSSLGITGDDTIMAPVPLYHSYGFDVALLAALHSGAKLIIEQNTIPRKIAETIGRGEVTVFLGVPNIYRFLIDTPFSTIPDFSRVRYLLSCTAPLHPHVIDAFYEKFGAVICQHYGSSETGAIANHIPERVMEFKESVGKPLNNVEVSLVAEDEKIVKTGIEGELVVGGPAVAMGYLLADENDHQRFVSGSYRTGDLGFVEDSGFISLTGRKDKIINVGGLKVSPPEVERVLLAHPAVSEAAVVGVRDSERQEMVYAGVTLNDAVSEGTLLEHCRRYLAEYKVPRRIEILDRMPKTATGKTIFNPEPPH